MLNRSLWGLGIIFLWVTVPVFADGLHSGLKLGKVEFSTSGSKIAQKHFLQGIAALHSFWYEEALKAFRQSTEVEPDFAMGYWGEAMAYNHPLWEDQDTQVGRRTIMKVKNITKISERERKYLDAVNLLYGEGDKPLRDKAYAKAMKKIYLEYPEDFEAACFYSLSLLGVARNSDNKLPLQIQAGEIGLEIFRKKPDHPCAAHYTIHAFDHPDLAIRALSAARRYAQIAPASHHAQHMPAHIFVQLGMWPEAAASNEGGWRNSVAWVEREGFPIGRRDFHSLQWLHYVYLQQGRYEEAGESFRFKLQNMMEASYDSRVVNKKTNLRTGKYLERMFGASVFEKEDWEWGTQFKEPPGWKPKPYIEATIVFVRGFAAAMQGQAGADRYLSDLKTIRSTGISRNYFKRPEHLEIWELEIQAAIQMTNKNFEKAILLMEKATAIESQLPSPSGPPRLIKPTYELLGEILLRAGKTKKAAKQFNISLKRHSNRARSLLGAARAASNQKDRAGAVERYSKFLSIWKKADSNLPELREAKNYLEQTFSSKN